DELFTDAYDIIDKGFVFEIDCKMIVVKDAEADIGANASAEETEEALEDGAQQVMDVVYSNRLAPTSFDKKSYGAYIKGYMKAILAKLGEGEDADRFKKEAPVFVKQVLENFKDYEFYTGESMAFDGMVVLLNYREDGTTPYLTFFKDGLAKNKL
ncbi:hypothetical protein H4R26_004794, partial [Coemansia thaxteri]